MEDIFSKKQNDEFWEYLIDNPYKKSLERALPLLRNYVEERGLHSYPDTDEEFIRFSVFLIYDDVGAASLYYDLRYGVFYFLQQLGYYEYLNAPEQIWLSRFQTEIESLLRFREGCANIFFE